VYLAAAAGIGRPNEELDVASYVLHAPGVVQLTFTPAVYVAAVAGIGRPNGELDVASYVLQEFKRSEMAAIDAAVEESLAIIHSCLALGLTKALSGQRT
jgi:peptidyl-tRNA hydrolase